MKTEGQVEIAKLIIRQTKKRNKRTISDSRGTYDEELSCVC